MAQTAITIVGGAVGFAVGGPEGARWGMMVGAMLGSYLYPPGSQTQAMRVGGLRFSAPQKGQVLPVMWGRNRLSGPIIWYGHFETHAADSGGSGGGAKGTGQETYTVGLAIALCEGRVSNLLNVWAGGDIADLDALAYDWEDGDPAQVANAYIGSHAGTSWFSCNLVNIGDTVHSAGLTARTGLQNGDAIEFSATIGGVTAGTTYYVANLSGYDFQVETTPGGGVIPLTDASNTVRPLGAVDPPNPAYPGVCYIVLQSYPLGYATSIPSFTFEIHRTTADVVADNATLTTLGLNAYPGDANGDVNPVVCLADFLTNPRYGLGFAATDLDAATFVEEAGHAAYMNLYCSPILDGSQPGTAHIEHLLSYFDGMLVFSQGTFKLHSRRSPSRENLPYTMIQPWEWLDGYVPKFSRATDRQIANTVTVEYLDRADGYNSGVTERRDDWDIGRRGLYREQLSLNGVTTGGMADKIASKLLWARITGPASAEWGMGPAGAWYEPGILVSFDMIGASAYALEGSIYRIVKITENPDQTFTFAGVEER